MSNDDPRNSVEDDFSAITISRAQPLARDGTYYPWLDYEVGKRDINGNLIESVHARSDEFIIYFSKPGGVADLYYECTDSLLEGTEIPNAQLARINRLAPESGSKRREILEFVADAFEMWLCGQKKESEIILKDLVAQLEGGRETLGRLYYQSAVLIAAVGVWIFYLANKNLAYFPELTPWLLAAALGATGGFFSVCLNLASIRVNVNQSLHHLYFAGGTRAVVALIAAVTCFLGIQGKIILGLAAADPAATQDALGISAAMMFFFFLSGFSESFIPNVLRDSEKNAGTGGRKPSGQQG